MLSSTSLRISARRSVHSARLHHWIPGRSSSISAVPRVISGSASFSTSSASPPHLFDRVLHHSQRPALFEAASINQSSSSAASWTYDQLLEEAVRLSGVIQQALPVNHPHDQPRVAYLGSRGASYVAMQWATWLAGGIGVPLHPSHPVEELQYIMDDSDAAVLIVSDEFASGDASSPLVQFVQSVQSSGKTGVVVHNRPVLGSSDGNIGDRGFDETVRKWLGSSDFDKSAAQIVYTSGTTGRPKGVVATHAGLTAQINDVVSAWEMTEKDHLLHFLPLHHVHGILNNLMCVHYAGGSLEFIPSAKPALVWSKLAESQRADSATRPVSMLMAVPTVYMNLLEEMERMQASDTSSFDHELAIEAARRLRVAISGSMACPLSILNRWEDLTGLRLLERYGMTELGMALTNPLHGERHLGYVGQPFPSVQVRLVDPESEQELDLHTEEEGELRVKGPIVFKEYWRKPEATAKEMDADGWFKTGDIAQYSVEKNSFRIRGRASADIIKTAGYKVSALDIERVLLSHPQIQECAVFGIPDEKYGQVVSALLRTTGGVSEELLEPPLSGFLHEHLADYRVPRKIFCVDEIPKNAMGKVNKKSLAALYK